MNLLDFSVNLGITVNCILLFNSLFFTVKYLKLRTFLHIRVYAYLNLGSVSFQFF